LKTHIERIIVVMACAGMIAAPPLAAQEYKLGVVNVSNVLENSPQADEARRKIQQEFAPREEDLAKLRKEIREIEEKLAKDGAVMMEEDRREVERKRLSRVREQKRLQDEFQEDFSYRRNEELTKIQDAIINTIQEVAKAEGYDLVLSQGFLYVNPELDITEQVISKLKQDEPAGTATEQEDN